VEAIKRKLLFAAAESVVEPNKRVDRKVIPDESGVPIITATFFNTEVPEGELDLYLKALWDLRADLSWNDPEKESKVILCSVRRYRGNHYNGLHNVFLSSKNDSHLFWIKYHQWIDDNPALKMEREVFLSRNERMDNDL
jgi:hypothetical protein